MIHPTNDVWYETPTHLVGFDGLLWPIAVVPSTAIGKAVGLIWDVNAVINDTVQLVWDTLDTTAIGDTVALLWDIRAAVGDPVQLVWDVESATTAVSDDVQLVWDIEAAVGEDLQLIWSVQVNIISAFIGWGIPI